MAFLCLEGRSHNEIYDKRAKLPLLQSLCLVSHRSRPSHKRIVVEQHGVAGLERAGHIDETLVGGTAEDKVGVAQRADERAVYEHINLSKQCPAGRMRQKVLKEKTREAPDGLRGVAADGLRQFEKALGLKHRVATGEGDIGKGIGQDFDHNLLRRHLMTIANVPRLRVMAALTAVGTTGTVDGSPESRPVYHGVMYDIQNTNHRLQGVSTWVTRSLSSASLPLFHRSVVPTR